MRIDIKPLSVNQAWQGRRFKTKAYKQYEKDVLTLLRPMTIPEGELDIIFKWGFSNSASDVDNPVKCFMDCLQKKYGFNDSRVRRIVAVKDKVKKGDEYIEFEIFGNNNELESNL